MSSQITITENGISVPQASEIKEAYQQVFINAFGSELSLDDSTPQGSIIDDLTIEKQQANTNILNLFNQFSPDTSSGIYQDMIASIFGIKRKSAQPSLVNCQCIGEPNRVIPKGTLVRSTFGDLFESIDVGTIGEGGSVTIQFKSVETGEIPCPANSVNKIFSSVVGLDSVNNENEGTLGYDEESDADFEERRKNELAKNATGSLGAVYSALMETDDVQDVFVWENPTSLPITYRGITLSAHSIYACINGGEPDGENGIAGAIYRSKSAGCDTTKQVGVSFECTYTDSITNVDYKFNYFRPIDESVFIKVGVGFLMSEDGESLVKDAIIQDWNGKLNNTGITIGSTIYASRFYKAIDSLSLTSFQLVNVKVSKGGNSAVTVSGSGITDAEVNNATFQNKIGDVAGTYAFSFDGNDWKLNGDIVDLEEYGITITGTAVNGDSISIVWTASVWSDVLTYNINELPTIAEENISFEVI